MRDAITSVEGVLTPPTDGQNRYEGVFSLVIDTSGQRHRRLPSLYLGTALLVAHRNVELVVGKLPYWVDIVRRAANEAVYLLHPIQIRDHRGLYARDFFIRSVYRRILVRSGAVFADSPFVTFAGDSRFVSEDWGSFEPEFVLLGDYDEDDPERIVLTSGGRVPFNVVHFRMGPVQPDEFSRFVNVLSGVPGIACANAPNLVEFIGSGGIQPD